MIKIGIKSSTRVVMTVHHGQTHVASPRGERLPPQVADHLSDAAYVVVPVASVPGRSALDHVKLVDIFSGYVGPIP